MRRVGVEGLGVGVHLVGVIVDLVAREGLPRSSKVCRLLLLPLCLLCFLRGHHCSQVQIEDKRVMNKSLSHVTGCVRATLISTVSEPKTSCQVGLQTGTIHSCVSKLFTTISFGPCSLVNNTKWQGANEIAIENPDHEFMGAPAQACG